MGLFPKNTITITDKKDLVEVEFVITDDSFSHEFGTQHVTGYEIYKVKVWVEIMDEWIDVTLDYTSIEDYVNRMVEDYIQNEAA